MKFLWSSIESVRDIILTSNMNYKLFLITCMVAVSLIVVQAPVASASYKSDVIEQINSVRKTGAYCGDRWYPPVKKVKHNKKLRRAAKKHSRSMANDNYFSHYGNTRKTKTPWKRIRKERYYYRAAGEVIAGGHKTPESVVAAWMRSPGHCRVIMNPRYKHVGVGRTRNSDSRWGVYWVVDFGRKK